MFPEAHQEDAGDLREAGELGEGRMDVVGWGDANLELVEGALFVYLGVDGADGDAVAPEDLERVLGPAIGFIEGDLQA